MVHIRQLETYAEEHNIPIMQKEGIEFLIEYIEKNNIHTILEIGTAIGYSAIRMALLSKQIKVVSIERDENRFSMAVQNVHDFHLEDQITLLFEDAMHTELSETFDLIFIDAAKSQYIPFFEKFKKNLNPNGVIISDNLSFHGLVETNEEIKSRNVRGIVRKIKNYIQFLKENEEFETTFYKLGDGVGVSKKK